MDTINFFRRHAEENFIFTSLALLILIFGLASDHFFSLAA